MFTRSILMAMVTITTFAVGMRVALPVVAQKVAVPRVPDNVALGENDVKRLLPLMGQDKEGKISKAEFMRFMEAEFNRLDSKKEGKLEVQKLVKPTRPQASTAFGK
jgi:hypothetical protein